MGPPAEAVPTTCQCLWRNAPSKGVATYIPPISVAFKTFCRRNEQLPGSSGWEKISHEAAQVSQTL